MFDKRQDLIVLPAARSSARSRRRDRRWTTIISARSSRASRSSWRDLERGAVEARRARQDRAQRGRPRAARARARLHHREHRHRPQPAHHGDDAEGRGAATVSSVCCTKSRSPASTAAASTTTGRISTDTGINLLEPRRNAVRKRAVSAVPVRGHPGGGRLSGSAPHLRRDGGQRPPSRRERSASRPSFPSSSATSSRQCSTRSRRTPPTPARKRSL